MAKLREIAQLGEPVLREIAAPITDYTDSELQELMQDMQLTLENSNGVGLAAPQVFTPQRMIIVASRPTPRYPYAPEMAPTLMLNPEFTALSEVQHKDWEGCLSIPGIRALVPRYVDIGVRYYDVHGRLQQTELQGFVARVFQHEFDHLQGLVYLDRVETNRDIVTEQEFLKLRAA